MKTSKVQQEQTRLALIRAAVDLMSAQGFDHTSMKQIARAAGVGDATIYKYFASKEKILLAYFDWCITHTLAEVQETPAFAGYTLQERVQRLIDALLETLLGDREFVAIVYEMARRSPFLMLSDQLQAHGLVKQEILRYLADAESAGEIVACDYKNLLAGWFMDYLLAILAYWLRDESDEFSDTTRMVDLSLSLFVLCLKSGMINKASELFGFMLKNQLARFLQPSSGLIDFMQGLRHMQPKRKPTPEA